MVNELEIQRYIERNDWEALGRIADWLTFDRQLTIEEVFRLFVRLGGDRPTIEAVFLGNWITAEC